MKHRRLLVTLACLCGLALSACGFHPRGELVIPDGMGPLKVVSSDPYNPLAAKLRRELSRAHALAGDDPAAKVTTLRIVSETWDTRPLSTNIHAQTTESSVTYVVKYSLADADGKDIEPAQEARLQRDYQYDVFHALGSAQEQDTIHDEMRRDIAATIIRGIGVALRHHQP